MKVILRHPKRRELEVAGRRRVEELLRELHVHPDTVLVIRGGELLTRDVVLSEDDVVEVRPVISGGTAPVVVGSQHSVLSFPLANSLRGAPRPSGIMKAPQRGRSPLWGAFGVGWDRPAGQSSA